LATTSPKELDERFQRGPVARVKPIVPISRIDQHIEIHALPGHRAGRLNRTLMKAIPPAVSEKPEILKMLEFWSWIR
jgi:hypothetical protein